MSSPRPVVPPPPPRTGMPAGVKWLIGCGIGCAVLLVIAVGAVVFGMWWITSPGKQVPTERIISPGATGVVHLSGDAALAECSELLGYAMARIQEEQNRQTGAQLPESLRWIEEMQRQQQMQGAATGMAMWVPREVTLVLYGDSDPEDRDMVVAANFRQFVRLFRTLITAAMRNGQPGQPGRVVHHDGHEILCGDDVFVCFVGGTVLLASDEERLRDVLDRLDQAELETDEPPAVFAGYEELKQSWPLFGILPNHGDGLVAELVTGSDLVDMVVEPGMVELPDGVEQTVIREVTELRFGLGLESADVLEGEIEAQLRGTDAAGDVKRYLEQRGEALREWARSKGLEPHGEITLQPQAVRQTIRFEGLKTVVDQAVVKSLQPPLD